MRSLKAVALLAVLTVMVMNFGCEKPKSPPPGPEPEPKVMEPSRLPPDAIPDNTTPAPVVTPAPAPDEPSAIEPAPAPKHHKATKSTKEKPKEKYASTPKKSGKTYVIKKGDTLQEISQQFYGTTKKWKKIAGANKSVIKDPNSLPVGAKIDIP